MNSFAIGERYSHEALLEQCKMIEMAEDALVITITQSLISIRTRLSQGRRKV